MGNPHDIISVAAVVDIQKILRFAYVGCKRKKVPIIFSQMGVAKNRGTLKSSTFNKVCHYKPSILGYPYFWKHPNQWLDDDDSFPVGLSFEIP